MKKIVTLEFGDTGEQVEVEVDDVPRIGEQILWTDVHGTSERMRKYQVHMVDRALSKDAPQSILVRCDILTG